ncbi:hypothetical protein M378DRAFT_158134 [Amanita muscaria Koide BX008]|uniref:UV excision repair protein RAD23 n=1 Tax=Amanita muscaria (strain Koide BX008) TaxID=946122 RepID=A0A0C2XJ27_AMAMK|nr:hypothetical protein M378DRAFT_158134 [Amanita muscaria Koide BX008]
MKITIKTTQQKVFHVDAELSDTIGDVKSKIQETQGHPVTDQKIIYSGKILSDDKSIESCGIKEKDFLVLMVTKRKPTPSPAPSATSPPVASAQPVANESTPSSTVLSHDESTSTQTSVSFLSGEALQTTVQNMVEMGFPREQVLRALRASFNNPDRAVEYLMNGIPAHLDTEAAPAPAPANPSSVGSPNANAPAASASPGHQNLFQLAHQQQHQQPHPMGSAAAVQARPDLSALRDNPQIQQLRQLVEQNPALIQPLIQQLASSNPAIAQLIAQHPEALLQLLNVPEDEDEGDAQGSSQVISVTEEERAAIERLEALGFPRYAAVEAYFACDKNEELAANYLFERGLED